MESLAKFMDALPVLHAKKNARFACILGLLFGGIGLGVDCRSVVDFVIPIGFAGPPYRAIEALALLGVAL